MRNLLLFGLLCFLVLAHAQPVRVSAGGAVDSLWTLAVLLAEDNDTWVPGSIYMHMQEVDKHGEPKDDRGHEVWTRLYLGDDGEVEYEMVKALENGEDITEEEKAKAEEEKAEEGDEDGDDNGRVTMENYTPFDPEYQDGLLLEATGEEEIVDDRQCAVFGFEDVRAIEDGDGDDEEGTVIGTAWLEVGTGVPVKVEYTTDPLPKRVKKMVTTMFYEYGGADSWYATNMNVRATGGFLFIKKHFHMNMTFEDYWRMPEEADSTGSAAGGAGLP